MTTIYLMNPHTGTVDTKDNWRDEYEAMEPCEWFGYDDSEESAEIIEDMSWDCKLIEVKKDSDGWAEAKSGIRRKLNQF